MLVTVSDIVKDSFLVCKNNWRNLAMYVLLLFLPSLILSFLGVVGIYLSNYSSAFSLATNLVILAVLAASLIFNIWASIALTVEIFNLLRKQTVNWKINFTSSSALIWPVLYTSFFVLVAVFGGSLLLIIPGIIFAGWFMFAVNLVILENKKGFDAMKESKNMVTGRWFPVMLRALVPAFIYGVAVMFLQYAILTPLEYLVQAPTVILVAEPIITSLINAISVPFAIAASLVLYLNLKNNPQSTI